MKVLAIGTEGASVSVICREVALIKQQALA